MCVCACVHMHVHICSYPMYACVSVCIRLNACAYVCVRAYVCVNSASTLRPKDQAPWPAALRCLVKGQGTVKGAWE